MQFSFLTLLFSLLAVLAVAGSTANQAVVVSYPDDTPESVIDDAKKAIIAAGGIITHEYKLINAFAATAPAEALELVQTQGAGYNAVVEEDRAVHALGDNF